MNNFRSKKNEQTFSVKTKENTPFGVKKHQSKGQLIAAANYTLIPQTMGSKT